MASRVPSSGTARPRSVRAWLDPLVAFVVIAVLWENAADLLGMRRYLLPPLSQVVTTFWAERAQLWSDAWVTTGEVLVGYVAAVAGGVLLGVAIHASATVRRTTYPLVVVFQGLPKIALAPLLVVWFGYGLSSKALMAFLFSFFPVVIATLGGLAGTPAHLIEHFRAVGASPWTTFRRLRIPSALPSILDGCKTAMPLAVIGAIAGEFVGAEKGLGHLILAANATARTDLVFAALVVIGIVSGLLYLVVELVGRRIWWRGL
jgi:NitT/TauT family transport system permease protein